MKNLMLISFLFISIISCRKTEENKGHTFGAIADDPERLAKVHVLMSASYYRTIPDKKKGKPPVDTTIIITPPPPPVYGGGYQIAMPAVLTQGNEGSCVAFASGYYIRSAEEYYSSNSTAYNASNILSPEYLFDQIKSDASTCMGTNLLAALDLMKAKGICTFQSMPYTDYGCSLVPTAEQDLEASKYKITGYSMLYTADTVLVKNLLNTKHPLYIAFNVDNYFYTAGPGFIWKTFSGTVVGQHCVTICGYDDSRHAWKIINSWGTGWGEAGYSWIDYDFLPQVTSVAVTISI